MKHFFTFIGALMCLLSAQAQGDTLDVSFDEALYKTYLQNPQMRAAEFGSEKSRYEAKAAFGLRLPKVGLTANYSMLSEDVEALNLNPQKDKLIQFMGTLPIPIPPAITGAIQSLDLRLVLQDKRFAFFGGEAVMPIFMGGKINVANRAAKLNVEKSKQNSEQVKNQLFSQLGERYFGLVLAGEAINVRRQVLEGMKKHLHDAVILEQTGMIAKSERLYAEMFVAEADKEYNTARRQWQTVNSALCNTLSEDGLFRPTTEMFVMRQIDDLQFFQSLAAESPLLKEVDILKKLSEEMVKLERSKFFPEVAVIGAMDFANYQLSSMVPKWAVGAGLKFNLFDGLTREYNFKAAKSQVKQAEAMQEQANADIKTLVEKLYNTIIVSGEQITALESAMEFGREYLRIKEQAFAEGTATSTDVVDAQLNLAKVRMERLVAAFTYDMMLAKLLDMCGASHLFNQYRTSEAAVAIRN